VIFELFVDFFHCRVELNGKMIMTVWGKDCKWCDIDPLWGYTANDAKLVRCQVIAENDETLLHCEVVIANYATLIHCKVLSCHPLDRMRKPQNPQPDTSRLQDQNHLKV